MRFENHDLRRTDSTSALSCFLLHRVIIFIHSLLYQSIQWIYMNSYHNNHKIREHEDRILFQIWIGQSECTDHLIDSSDNSNNSSNNNAEIAKDMMWSILMLRLHTYIHTHTHAFRLQFNPLRFFHPGSSLPPSHLSFLPSFFPLFFSFSIYSPTL